MARDLGHALTIEIDKKDDNYNIKYFIPKACNIEKLNKLKGVSKLDKNASVGSSTVGEFTVSKENFISELCDFLENVPTDSDIKLSKELNDMLNYDEIGDDYNGYSKY